MKSDKNLWKKLTEGPDSEYEYVEVESLEQLGDSPEVIDAALDRLALLYYKLYVGKYSNTNVIFTSHFIKNAILAKTMNVRLFRTKDGRIGKLLYHKCVWSLFFTNKGYSN